MIASESRLPRATPREVPSADKIYVTGDFASTFYPSGTTLIMSYRHLNEPQPNGPSQYRTQRVNVRLSQDLHLPFDLKVLLGVEVARASNSPFLLDSADSDGTSRKYIGGLAVNF